jgi:hypothetical protein
MRRIKGECDARFERVREAFAENFDKRGDVGAAVAARVSAASGNSRRVSRVLRSQVIH